MKFKFKFFKKENNWTKVQDMNYISQEELYYEGWKFDINGPSAEGPTYKKGDSYVQLLAKGNINAGNAGLNPNIINITFWVRNRNSISVIFLGVCRSIEEFKQICKFLNIS